MSEETKTYSGQTTADQIKEWKNKYGQDKVFGIVVDDKIAYLKKPDRKVLSAASTAGNNPIAFNEIVLRECWLGGDEEIRKNDDLFMSISPKLTEMVELKEAELVKL